jgi:D-amino-acid dehydrogenase
MRPRTGVIGIEHRQGRVSAVATPDGRITARHVVVCAGAWTPVVLRLAGARMPIEAGKGYSLDYAPPPDLSHPVRRPLSLHEARVAVTPLDGCLRLAGTMELSGLNHRLESSRLAAIARAGDAYLHGWPADPPRPRVWTGSRPMTPDGLPVIGLVPGFSNVAVASGHAMLGVTLAPVTGEAIAELLTVGKRPEGLAPFDPGRFGRR